MAIFTQILNVKATGIAGGLVTLTIDQSSLSSTGASAAVAVAAIPVDKPLIDLSTYSMDDAGESNFTTIALSINAASLDLIGKGATFTVGTTVVASPDFTAAMNALLAPVDAIGGRSYISQVIVDPSALPTSGIAAVVSTVGVPPAALGVIDYTQYSHSDMMTSNGSALTKLAGGVASGFARFSSALLLDPGINGNSVQFTQLTDAFSANSKLYTAIGNINSLDLMEKVATLEGVAMQLSSGDFPISVALLSQLGQLEYAPTMIIDVSTLTTNTFSNLSIEHIRTIAANNLNFQFAKISSSNEILDEVIDVSKVFRIRDTSANISAMTVEAAQSMEAMNTNFRSLVEGMPGSGGPKQPLQIIPSDAVTTPITMDYLTLVTLANSGFAIAQSARVTTLISNTFGSITGEDLGKLAMAGVDNVNFDVPVTPAPTPLVPNPLPTPNYPEGSRQLIIEQQDSWAVSKLNVSGLDRNNSIDVAFSVDDTPMGQDRIGGINIPANILKKFGVDRIISSDGVLDMKLSDAQKLLPRGVTFGNKGDSTDVNVYMTRDNELSSLKAATVTALFNAGVDKLIYVGNSISSVPGPSFSDTPVIDLSNSASRSKNVIDSMATAIRAGMQIDFGQGMSMNDEIAPYAIKLAASSLALAGAGANFNTFVNGIGDQGVALGKNTRVNGQDLSTSVLVKSAAVGNWLEVSDLSGLQGEGNFAPVKDVATFIKLASRASVGGNLVVDMLGADQSSGLQNFLADKTNDDISAQVKDLKILGKELAGVKNVYADLRLEDGADTADESQDWSTLLANYDDAGFRGVLIDSHTLVDFAGIESELAIDLDISNGDQAMDLSYLASTLNVIYVLDASNGVSSNGLSKYVSYGDGSYYFNGNAVEKDSSVNFMQNLSTIDKVMITNGASGDLAIDLSGFGVTQDNFATKITAKAGVAGTSADSFFMLTADNGKAIEIQIVGLQQNSGLFTAADLIQSPALSME